MNVMINPWKELSDLKDLPLHGRVIITDGSAAAGMDVDKVRNGEYSKCFTHWMIMHELPPSSIKDARIKELEDALENSKATVELYWQKNQKLYALINKFYNDTR